MYKQEVRKVVYQGREIPYVLTRKAVKNINLRIKPDRTVAVSAAARVGVSEVESFLIAKGSFILAALDQFSKREIPAPKNYVTGETFLYLGREIPLLIRGGKRNETVFTGEELLLYIATLTDRDQRRRLVQSWYQKEAQQYFAKLCGKVYPLFAGYGIQPPVIRLRSMKSRWGSCHTQKGIVTLNTKLIQTPPECIEYVAVHEFAHFIHPNHSAEFHALVQKLLPDWRERKKLLEEFGVRILPEEREEQA